MTAAAVTIQIPLYNETDALRLSYYYFRQINVPVRYVMDTQCLPETRAIVEELGIEPYEFENDRPFIENGYKAFSDAADNDWILRIDCDELPTPELIEFAQAFAGGGSGVAGFQRLQVIWSDARFKRSTNERFDPVNQTQYRLYDRRAVQFDTDIHTPGIRLETVTHAPPAAKLYHLSWIFLTWEERVKKADRYQEHGQAETNRTNQLLSLEDQCWTDIEPTIIDEIYASWLKVGADRRTV